jgi:hypothetical protein
VAVVSLVIGAFILVAIIGIAAYGWATLPADARIPIHYGVGYNNFRSKTVGLIMWPAAAVVIYGTFVAVTAHVIQPHHPGGGRSAPLVILPIVLAMVCAFEWGAISVARRNTGLGPDGP